MLDRYLDILAFRVFRHGDLETLAAHADAPVVNLVITSYSIHYTKLYERDAEAEDETIGRQAVQGHRERQDSPAPATYMSIADADRMLSYNFV